jgi:hypothetical protein
MPLTVSLICIGKSAYVGTIGADYFKKKGLGVTFGIWAMGNEIKKPLASG